MTLLSDDLELVTAKLFEAEPSLKMGGRVDDIQLSIDLTEDTSDAEMKGLDGAALLVLTYAADVAEPCELAKTGVVPSE